MSCSKEGSLVFFGDATRGHVLSYTFQIHDSQARGFFRLFSIIVLMKDKMYLLNLQPFLAENLHKISEELQTYSSQIHSAEQAKYSERAQRLNSGHASTQPPRSLIELTGEKNVFAYIHSHFAWILWMGARCLTENINIGIPRFNSTNNKLDPFSVIQLKPQDLITIKKLSIENDNEHIDFIRKCQRILNEDFPAACYCVLVGIQVRQTTDHILKKNVRNNSDFLILDRFERSTVHINRISEVFWKTFTRINASSNLH